MQVVNNIMDCQNLEEVRGNIDRIDNEIIKLIAERGSYVKQASKFKTSNQDVKAPQRVESVIQKVRALSEKYGANPDMTEKLYRDMIADFVNMEINEFNNANR